MEPLLLGATTTLNKIFFNRRSSIFAIRKALRSGGMDPIQTAAKKYFHVNVFIINERKLASLHSQLTEFRWSNLYWHKTTETKWMALIELSKGFLAREDILYVHLSLFFTQPVKEVVQISDGKRKRWKNWFYEVHDCGYALRARLSVAILQHYYRKAIIETFFWLFFYKSFFSSRNWGSFP